VVVKLLEERKLIFLTICCSIDIKLLYASSRWKYFSNLFALAIIGIFSYYFFQSYGQIILKERPYSLSALNPQVFDSGLKIEEVTEGPDNNKYVPVGDIDGSFKKEFQHIQTQNFGKRKVVADGRSGILRITQEGKHVGMGILGDSMPLRLYYAYGIRNSFGLDFDPVTGRLWETENGPQDGDEINLVEPGFNSGWNEIYGFSTSLKTFSTNELVTFENKGHYEEPKLVWAKSTGLTSIVFLDTDKLGKSYRNDIFVGSVHNGHIYHFKLNKERTDLALPRALAKRYIQNLINLGAEEVVFASGLGGITDLTEGPDGYLYMVSIAEGKIFRILPK
jgi:glucose/arabinose dehydrogenase